MAVALVTDEEVVCPRCRDHRRKATSVRLGYEDRPGYFQRVEADPELRKRIERQRLNNDNKPSAGEMLLRHERKIEETVERLLPPLASLSSPRSRRGRAAEQTIPAKDMVRLPCHEANS